MLVGVRYKRVYHPADPAAEIARAFVTSRYQKLCAAQCSSWAECPTPVLVHETHFFIEVHTSGIRKRLSTYYLGYDNVGQG